VAYRWESSLAGENVKVNAEKITFYFADDYNMYYPAPNGDAFFSHQECDFLYKKLSEIDSSQNIASTPALVEMGKRYMLITDVNVEHYPGLWIKAGDGTKLEGIFPHYPAETKLTGDRNLIIAEYSDYLSESAGTRAFPWRAFVIAEPKAMLTSTMLYCLADPCRLEDTSWIKPGKVAWDWWNARNITDVPFKAGINQDTYKNYIDFASANGLSYVILDEGWSVRGADNLLQVIPELNISELVEYGRAKNVGIIIWMTSAALERNFDQAFKQFNKWGVRGLKIDFMQRDDQKMMDFCQKAAIEAAKYKLIVDFHGGSKPTGLQRTYPNVLTHESVLGLEQSKWSTKASPDMAVLLPFIRMMVGPMDYTPGGMDNFTRSQFKSKFDDPGTLGTRCHQLAMYVTYISPLQMLADTPTKYRENPDSMKFLREVPTTWDETVVMEAEVGKVIALARRDGERWFLGAMTNWDKRELDLSLSFLTKGNYTLRYWADGSEAENDATDTTLGQMAVNAESVIKISLSSGGGYASIIEPE
jgi:alpha-glucosidase